MLSCLLSDRKVWEVGECRWDLWWDPYLYEAQKSEGVRPASRLPPWGRSIMNHPHALEICSKYRWDLKNRQTLGTANHALSKVLWPFSYVVMSFFIFHLTAQHQTKVSLESMRIRFSCHRLRIPKTQLCLWPFGWWAMRPKLTSECTWLQCHRPWRSCLEKRWKPSRDCICWIRPLSPLKYARQTQQMACFSFHGTAYSKFNMYCLLLHDPYLDFEVFTSCDDQVISYGNVEISNVHIVRWFHLPNQMSSLWLPNCDAPCFWPANAYRCSIRGKT